MIFNKVERVRLFLRLRERLKSLGPKPKEENSKKQQVRTPVSPCEPKWAIPTIVKLSEAEKKIAEKVVYYINVKLPLNKESPTGKKVNNLSF